MNARSFCCAAAVTVIATLSAQAIAPLQLEWQQTEDLPDAVGRKGMFGGVSGGHVLLAGGSNFPVPQRAGGRKTFHRDVWVRPLPLTAAKPWCATEFQLPGPLGEGASVTSERGIIGVGGHDGTGPVATVFLLNWNRAASSVERRVLPDLPEAAANAAAVLLNGRLYVAGGEGKTGALATCWRLEVARALANPREARWEPLPSWPGPGRFGGILNVVTTAAGPRLLFAGGLAGPAKGTSDYLREVMLFDPESMRWSSGATMLRGAVLGASIAMHDGRLLVLGGSDGHDFERMKQLGERYRIPSDVLLYDARADRWSTAGAMPLGTVGSAVVDVGESWLVAGGEYSPGLRTPRVYQLRVYRP